MDEEGLTHKEGRESHKLQVKSEDLRSLMRRKNLTNLVMRENITTSMRRENPNNNKVKGVNYGQFINKITHHYLKIFHLNSTEEITRQVPERKS